MFNIVNQLLKKEEVEPTQSNSTATRHSEKSEINTKKEAIRSLEQALSYYSANRKTLAVQMVAASIEFIIMSIAKNKFDFKSYIDGVASEDGFDSDTLNILIDEAKRTVTYFKVYGQNSNVIFDYATKGTNKTLVDTLHADKKTFSMIHSTDIYSDFDEIIKMGGMYARYRMSVYFTKYEAVFAKSHLMAFMSVFNPAIENRPSDEQIKQKYGIHFFNIGVTLGRVLEDKEGSAANHRDIDLALHIFMFMKDKFGALLVKNGKGEVITTDYFNLNAEYDEKQQLLEPIYSYNGITEYYEISPIPDTEWKTKTMQENVHTLSQHRDRFTDDPTSISYARAIVPQFN